MPHELSAMLSTEVCRWSSADTTVPRAFLRPLWATVSTSSFSVFRKNVVGPSDLPGTGGLVLFFAFATPRSALCAEFIAAATGNTR